MAVTLQKGENLEIYVSELLRELGVPAKLNGYRYLREGIMMLVYDMDVAGAITKVLYNDIAARHGSTIYRVERAIRTAVMVSWQNGNHETLRFYFGTEAENTRRPCNSEYMIQIADKIRLDRKYAS